MHEINDVPRNKYKLMTLFTAWQNKTNGAMYRCIPQPFENGI